MPPDQPMMEVRSLTDKVNAIQIAGEMTRLSEDALRSAHERASEGDTRAVVLNFDDLEYMNSSGIGLLVTTLIRAQRSGQQLLAVGLTAHYREIFSLTRLDEAIGIFDTEAAALKSL
jgi:anti-sigma B factor antagonist